MISYTAKKRMGHKSELNQLLCHLNKNYGLSLTEADALAKELIEKIYTSDAEVLTDGQMWYTAVALEEPAGKPLAKCRKVRIKLSLLTPEDLESSGIKDLKQMLVYRLCWQAVEQQATLTIEDLALLLHTSESSIKRYIDYHRKAGLIVPTRGFCHDIGPGISHKAQVVLLYLKGLQVTEIGNRLAHNIHSVERYLDDFCVVWMGFSDGYSTERIARNTRISERIVEEYLYFIEKYSSNPEYTRAFDKLKLRLDHLLKKRDLIGGGRI